MDKIESVPEILVDGERRDSEWFEAGFVDASWIPAGFAWQSLGVFRDRLNDLEEYARENLESTQTDSRINPGKSKEV